MALIVFQWLNSVLSWFQPVFSYLGCFFKISFMPKIGMAVWRVTAAGNITKAGDWPYYSGVLVS